MDEEMRVALAALGMTKAGMLADLAAEDVEQRWGANGLASWRLARGEDARRPVLSRTDARRAVAVELPSPVETTEPVLFLVRAALERLAAELVTDGKAAAAIAITLTLDVPASALPSGRRAHTITREVRPARPLARVPQLVELCRALLDGWTLNAPVCGVEVAIVAVAPATGEQGDLLDTSWRDPSAAHAAFTRLRTELGADVVVRPRARDEHRPEHAGGWTEVLEPGAEKVVERPAVPDESTRAMRMLETPERVDVETPGGSPVAAWWRGTRVALTQANGPERLSGDWWRDPYRRDYWRCAAEDGGVLMLYRDHSDACWYVQGWED
jgi:protein ImuB